MSARAIAVMPRSGTCCICHDKIGFYESYWLDCDTNEMYCSGRDQCCTDDFLLQRGFQFYTDG